MPRTIEITLTAPLKGHGGDKTKVVLREPTFEEYFRFGDPYILVPLEGGGYYPAEDRKILEAYMGLLVTDPDISICRQGGLALARQLKDAIISFFLPATAEDAGSKT